MGHSDNSFFKILLKALFVVGLLATLVSVIALLTTWDNQHWLKPGDCIGLIPAALYVLWFGWRGYNIVNHLGYCPACHVHGLERYYTGWKLDAGLSLYYQCANCGARYGCRAEADLIGPNWFDACDAEHDWAYQRGTHQAWLKFEHAPLAASAVGAAARLPRGNLRLLRQREIRDVELYYDDLHRNAQWSQLKTRWQPGDELWEYEEVPALSFTWNEYGLALVRQRRVVCKAQRVDKRYNPDNLDFISEMLNINRPPLHSMGRAQAK